MKTLITLCFCALGYLAFAQKHDGISNNLDNLFRLSDAKTRSISPENFSGEKGKGGMATEGTGANAARGLGQGWKVSPSVKIPSKTTFTMAEINGSGAIQHIWLTPAGIKWRYAIIRIYWDDEKEPSVEAPLGDFFCMGWNQYAPVNSLAVCVNPGSAFNCYWVMPFRKKAKITIENLADEEFRLYYQVDYVETTVPDDAAYFHAQFRRTNPVPYKEVYTLVDGIKGKGHYVGTYIAWGVHNNGWWGEGEIKFYIDGDKDFPTICGTGTEDYFCGSYDFDVRKKNAAGVDVVEYQEFNTPYVGLPQVIRGDGHYQVMQRFGMYRWHIPDPIRFEKDLKVTIQALGWRGDGRYLPLQDDISSVVFWYQTEPHGTFPKLPERDKLEVN
ncbi:MAG TPA: DUF2961 domain-containing protein [Haliscomenobacter sp.]|uniref:glycoside hydrolase family 172 protein n=1 Tax=Haliscomenobacter sp. TaxID=2717303 RepID=UPI002C848FDD|nr:glycoside hydrolase family 172 protein [Haliscomenobacter sp.]HOY18216.1 DUF2961 domain-containing protein [Haliscomenobacter sp.]